jgi:hypothetical protein
VKLLVVGTVATGLCGLNWDATSVGEPLTYTSKLGIQWTKGLTKSKIKKGGLD